MLTSLQKKIVQILAPLRHEGSYFAGGSILNLEAPRRSHDFDIFHDDMALCQSAFAVDIDMLRQHGMQVEIVKRPQVDYIGLAEVRSGTEKTQIEWVRDSVFRFFPIEQDAEFGFVLNYHDLATNKILALAGRSVVRDYYDVCTMIAANKAVIAYCWAACGKDSGYSPVYLLEQMTFNSRFSKELFEAGLDFVTDSSARLSAVRCKELFMGMVNDAREAFSAAPLQELGCLYMHPQNGEVFFPTAEDFAAGSYYPHKGKAYGAVPQFLDTHAKPNIR